MNLSLKISKLKIALLKRSKALNNKKSYDSWSAKHYISEPEISFIIQSHNKSAQVCHIVGKLRKYPDSEIIVIDDGSSENHTSRLSAFLKKANEFLIKANDLYEVITYDRAIRFANGKYVVLLQDDDDFDSLEWIHKGLLLMKEHADMAILGGRGGRNIIFNDSCYETSSDAVKEGSDFCFVQTINRAPEWINKALFSEKLYHIDQNYAPFQYDDYEICLRAWLSGLKIGWYNAGFHSLSAGGMRLYNNLFIAEQCRRNGEQLFETYHNQMEKIKSLVEAANKAV